jgi:hypothetical protein
MGNECTSPRHKCLELCGLFSVILPLIYWYQITFLLPLKTSLPVGYLNMIQTSCLWLLLYLTAIAILLCKAAAGATIASAVNPLSSCVRHARVKEVVKVIQVEITNILSVLLFIAGSHKVFCVFLNEEISYLYNSTIFRIPLIASNFFINSIIAYHQFFLFGK